MSKCLALSLFCLASLLLLNCAGQSQRNNPAQTLHNTSCSPFQARMTLLSYIAYCKSNEIMGTREEKSLRIKVAIESALRTYQPVLGEWTLVWGPAVNFPDGLFYSDALVYIVKEKATGHHALVVRGTNPFSLWTWLNQDLQVADLVSWENAVADFPGRPPQIPGKKVAKLKQDERAISLGAYNSLAIHTNLKPVAGCPGEGTTFLEFLTKTYLPADREGQLYYTGHSLGGLLASTLALWVQDKEEGMQKVPTSVAAFAGLTAGNEAFADYSNRMLHNKQDKWLIRYANPLDLVVNVWNVEAMENLLDIYGLILPIFQFPSILTTMEIVRDKNYTQVGMAVEVASEIDPLFYDYNLQATYQHVMPYLIACFGKEQAYEIIAYIFELSFTDMMVELPKSTTPSKICQWLK